jgi:hypothetical protein
VGRIDREIVRERQDPIAQRPEQRPRQGLGLLGADQVGACHRADDQRPAAEQGDRPLPIEQQVREVLGRVARRADDAEGQAAEVVILVILERPMRECQLTTARGEDRGSLARELTAAGHEIGMQMRLQAVRQLQVALGREPLVGPHVAHRIDDQPAALPEVHDVGRVAEPLIDEWSDLFHCDPCFNGNVAGAVR